MALDDKESGKVVASVTACDAVGILELGIGGLEGSCMEGRIDETRPLIPSETT